MADGETAETRGSIYVEARRQLLGVLGFAEDSELDDTILMYVASVRIQRLEKEVAAITERVLLAESKGRPGRKKRGAGRDTDKDKDKS